MSTDPTTATTPRHRTDHYWLGDEEGHNCETCIERSDSLFLCWPQAHLCAVCEEAVCDWPDIMCQPCRTAFVRSCDEVVDPVEQVLGEHLLVVVSDGDHQLCICGWQVEGGPALHRRHVAAAIYQALDLDGPAPWKIGPDSEMGPLMEQAGQPPQRDNGSQRAPDES